MHYDKGLSADLIPSVAMPFMNTVHHEELALVNSLLERLECSGDDETIKEKLKGWLDHTVAHFAREEHYMQEYRFPPYSVHRGEHQAALQQLENVIAQWNAHQDRDALVSFIRESWEPWLHNHIDTMDAVTAQFLSQFNIEVDL